MAAKKAPATRVRDAKNGQFLHERNGQKMSCNNRERDCQILQASQEEVSECLWVFTRDA